MRVHILYAIVTSQILIFQFISVRFLGAIPEYFLGNKALPEEIADAIRQHKRSLSQRSYRVGAALWIAMTVTVYGLPFTHSPADRLIVAGASLVSSALLLWTYLRAGRDAQGIADMLPDSGKRLASLERRTLGRYYSVTWEFLPFGILLAATAFTMWALPQLEAPYPVHYDSSGIPDRWGQGGGRFVSILIVQAVAAFGLFFLTFGVLRGRGCLSPKAPIAAQAPAEAGQVSEISRKRELRFFMAAKIAVALQFGLILLVKIRVALGNVPSPWMAGAPWVATLLLLVIFAAYAIQTAKRRTGSVQ